MPFVSAAIFIMGSLAFPANTTLLQTLTLAHITLPSLHVLAAKMSEEKTNRSDRAGNSVTMMAEYDLELIDRARRFS